MSQQFLLRRDELARTYQLGAFLQEYPPHWNGVWTWGGGMCGPIIAVEGVALIFGGRSALSADALYSCLGVCLFIVATLAFFSFTKRQYVSVYTNGFLCLRGKSIQVARWEQIRQTERVQLYRQGYNTARLRIDLNDGTSLWVGAFVAHYKDLWVTIERHGLL